MSSPSSNDALPEHAYYCFEVIQAALDGNAAPEPPFDAGEALCVLVLLFEPHLSPFSTS